MDSVLTQTVGLLGIAILVAIAARRLALPYTVGLVITGIGLATLRLQTGALLTHDFIFELILPPLLFEAAINIRWRELRRDLVLVLALSTLGVVISAAFVAAGMTLLLAWPIQSALVFGVLIAATDPVAVIALFRDIGATGRLRQVVESESLFNDGVAAVLFGLALAWAEGGQNHSSGALATAIALVKVAGGGVLTGLLGGLAANALAGRTQDHLIETALTAVAAYGSFLLAENLGMSGVLASVAAGLLMGNLGALNDEEKTSLEGRAFVGAFWEFAAFIANSLVFLLIGLRVASIAFASIGFAVVPVAICLVLAGRMIAVYPLCAAFAPTRWAVAMRDQHILWWGGLRGALALALALGLPPGLPLGNEILIATFGVVTFSILVQGLTMPALMRVLNRSAKA